MKAMGSSRLLFAHPADLVVRKSRYICTRTVAIMADKAAGDLPREFVIKMLNPNHRIKIKLVVESE